MRETPLGQMPWFKVVAGAILVSGVVTALVIPVVSRVPCTIFHEFVPCGSDYRLKLRFVVVGIALLAAGIVLLAGTRVWRVADRRRKRGAGQEGS